MQIKLPWVTLKGTPTGPGIWARLKCAIAMLLHEAVEVLFGSHRAHNMRASERYGFEPVTAAVVGEAVAAGAAEAAVAGAGEAAVAGAGEAAVGTEAASAAEVGQTRNLAAEQFGSHKKGSQRGVVPTVGGTPSDWNDPGYVG